VSRRKQSTVTAADFETNAPAIMARVDKGEMVTVLTREGTPGMTLSVGHALPNRKTCKACGQELP
jgi:antitoxin (DNA-binding transcriptional repressor) of toxin-antitoxin stability system